MATYKVIQDIESEDKLLGPLTLRQFIYAAIVVVMGFTAFKLVAINALFVIPFLLPMAFFALLAAPFGHDQSSEVWLLAKIGFLLKPRRRIWDQTGMQELVSITVPKRVEEHLTDGLTQSEVKSRLQALANTIDSRGWAVKNVNVNLYTQPSYLHQTEQTSDRLVDSSSLPQAVPNYEVVAADDILDEANNPTAQHLNTMINQSEQAHRKTLVATVQNGPAAPPADYWFMNQPSGQTAQKPGYATFDSGPTVLPGANPTSTQSPMPSISAEEEKKLLEQIHLENTKPNPAYGHMRVLDPAGSKPAKTAPSPGLSAGSAGLRSAQAAIARLSGNDDLNVSTIAREANKATKPPADDLPDDEVVISLR